MTFSSFWCGNASFPIVTSLQRSNWSPFRKGNREPIQNPYENPCENFVNMRFWNASPPQKKYIQKIPKKNQHFFAPRTWMVFPLASCRSALRWLPGSHRLWLVLHGLLRWRQSFQRRHQCRWRTGMGWYGLTWDWLMSRSNHLIWSWYVWNIVNYKPLCS